MESDNEISGFDTDYARACQAGSGADVFACYQCEKCTNGCPLTFAMDAMPHTVIRMIQAGLSGEVSNAVTPWVCASCETCVTRCPNNVDIPRLMDFLKQDALRKGVEPKVPDVLAFHETFMNNIRLFGRVQETALMGAFQLKSIHSPGDIVSPGVMDNVKLGLKMIAKGRMGLIPKFAKARARVRKLF